MSWKCQGCHTEMADHEAFCENCGSRKPDDRKTEQYWYIECPIDNSHIYYVDGPDDHKEECEKCRAEGRLNIEYTEIAEIFPQLRIHKVESNDELLLHFQALRTSTPCSFEMSSAGGTLTRENCAFAPEYFAACRSVSAPHCEVSFADGRWYVKDLNSRHGTFISSRQVLNEDDNRGESIEHFPCKLRLADAMFKIAQISRAKE